MNEARVLTAIVAFAAGVATMDYAHERQAQAAEPIRCLPCPDAEAPGFIPSRAPAPRVRA